MRKKSNSRNYVCYRSDRKTWVARYEELDIKSGKIKMKSKSFKLKEDAEKFIDMIMYQKEDPLYIENKGIPLCEFMKANAKLKIDANQITEITYARTLDTIKQIEKFKVAKKNIDEIKDYELQEFMNAHKRLSNSTISKLYLQFKTTFNNAMLKGYINRNPMVNVLKPRSIKEDKKVRALTIEEQQNFTDYLLSKNIQNCKYKNVYLIQMFCGLRVGEVLALKTSDVNLKTMKLNINRTLTKDENGAVVMGKTTKTFSGKRVVPIPEFLLPSILEQYQDAILKENNEEKMLFKLDGYRYMNRGNVNDELKRILKKYFNITDISTHSLRHTYGTRCIESGMAPVVVQRFMGHSDIGVTLNTYTSVFDNFKEQEVEKINNYYLKQNLYNEELIDLNIDEKRQELLEEIEK